MTGSLKGKHFPILLLLISFATVVGLLFTPALPELAKDFGISESKAQWLITIFLFGYCIGQLPYGPLSNRFGRKPTIFFGIALSLLGSILCIFATSFSFLCFARLIQSLGAAVGLQVTFTMVSDQRSGASATKMIALLSLAFGLTQGLAVAIGGFITPFAGWKGCFIFLTVYSVFLALLCLALPETSKPVNPDRFKLSSIAKNYSKQFKDSFLMRHAILVSLATTMIYIYATLSPYIAIQVLGLSPPAFGLWNLIPAIGLLCGAFISQHFASKTTPRTNIASGILIAFLGTLVMAYFFSWDLRSEWTLFLPQFFIQIGSNLAWSNSSAKGLSESVDKSNAAAVLQFINLSGAVIGVYLVGRFSPGAEMLLPSAYLIALVSMFVIWISLKAHHKRTSGSSKS
jgi:predicted MFS family arabinose efflux permease